MQQLGRLVQWAFALALLSSCGEDFRYEQDTAMNEVFTVTTTTRLNEWEVAKLLVDAGFKAGEIHPMICIAKHESGFRTNAMGAVTKGKARGSRDVGIFQINSYYWARPKSVGGCGMTEQELIDPLENARCARIVYKRHGFDAWVAFRKHRMICTSYVANLRKRKTSNLL